ncbi:hypothetical protein SLEP1_g36037 [Rubroshorea leprosula]|uniref:Uncharacterized protein n=1 Tax=Rubroshorea leprosula TaxID=152421 RepID=A0AAV5KQJ4_9ROSI|nr:hypothetical protein SLEP1_g36037 [Rubroshorea leprosula]
MEARGGLEMMDLAPKRTDLQRNLQMPEYSRGLDGKKPESGGTNKNRAGENEPNLPQRKKKKWGKEGGRGACKEGSFYSFIGFHNQPLLMSLKLAYELSNGVLPCTSQGISALYSLQSIVKKFFDTYIIIRMKMVDGDFTLKAIIACSVPLLTTFACVFLGKDLMVVKTMPVQERTSGFLTMAVSLTNLLGERLGHRYYEYLTGQEATDAPRVLEDLYYPHPLIQDLMWNNLYVFAEPLLTRWPLNKLVREKALQVTMEHIHYEDENSRYITIGCVEKCCLLMSTLPQEIVGEKLEPERLYDTVNVVLSLRSKNGGLSAWEPAGASRWLEMLNPTGFFEDIVIEHEYVGALHQQSKL